MLLHFLWDNCVGTFMGNFVQYFVGNLWAICGQFCTIFRGQFDWQFCRAILWTISLHIQTSLTDDLNYLRMSTSEKTVPDSTYSKDKIKLIKLVHQIGSWNKSN